MSTTTTTTAPPRPEKSKLRQKSIIESDPIPAAAQSRFTEQFDIIPPPELLDALADTDFHVSTTRKNSKPSTIGKTLRPFLPSSPSTSTIPTLDQHQHPLVTGNESTNNHSRPPLSNSATRNAPSAAGAPPLMRSQSAPWMNRLFNNSDEDDQPQPTATLSSKQKRAPSITEEPGQPIDKSLSTSTKGSTRMPSLFSLNRAEVIVTRLDQWQLLLKAVIAWLEEVVKIHFQSSRSYSQRSLPFIKHDFSHQHRSNNDDEEEEKDALTTLQAGLQMLTMHVANEQKEFGKHIQQDILPGLHKLRRDCKDMIRGLKEEPELVMDELLRLAETTRKSMAALNKHCKAADAGKHIEHDPMLSNLYVLRHLKREIDEENRMRELMVPIQKGTAAFEARCLEQLKPAIAYCYQFMAPQMWDNTEDQETASFKLVMDQLMPDHEWKRFYESKKKDLVNEENPKKDYLKINYPNKMNPFVMTVAKGVLERRIGVLKQFTDRYYILSHCGYLHEFTMDDKVSPERSIYMPDSTVVPSIDISHLANDTPSDNKDGPYTFEIHKRGTQVLQRDRVYVFRTNSREELLSWCRALVDASTRTTPPRAPIMPQHANITPTINGHPHQISRPPSTHGSSSSSQTSSFTQQQSQQQHPIPASGSTVSVPNTVRPQSDTNNSRPASTHDNDDAASIMTARPTAPAPAPETPTSTTSLSPPPPAATSQDAVKEQQEPEQQQQQQHDENDANTQRFSRASTQFDDSESSVYFSSTSAPPSPSASSIVSLSAVEDTRIPALDEEIEEPSTPRPTTANTTFYMPMLNTSEKANAS